jgi:hypothetical protein
LHARASPEEVTKGAFQVAVLEEAFGKIGQEIVGVGSERLLGPVPSGVPEMDHGSPS